MPAAPPFWNDDPESWDTAVVGGVQLPGLARIDGLELASKWDVKEAPGTDGATETYQGYTPSSFTLLLRMWERDQWTAWLGLVPKFRPRPGKESPDPVEVVHPELAAWGIARAIIRKLKPKKSDDVYEVSFDMLEYFPQPKKSVTSTATSASQGVWNALDGSPDPRHARPPTPSSGRPRP
ncbi:MAG: hypothetical protein ACXWUG_20255 [Polyangiales bacterium]